ncbi:MAG TPA: SGNH/GDSL hydrolase family protein [Cellulomonadaceae bacterium]|nr:SGNH/GDSL hydrolase family protein [Cellulomonadaceae bacterium]
MSSYDPSGAPGPAGPAGAVLVRTVAGRQGDVVLAITDIAGGATAASVTAEVNRATTAETAEAATRAANDTTETNARIAADTAEVTSRNAAISTQRANEVDTASFAPTTVLIDATKQPTPQTVTPMRALAPRRFGALIAPDQNRKLGRANNGADAQTAAALHINTRRNLFQYTEAVSSNRYAVQNSVIQADTITVDGIVLTRVTLSNFFGSLRTQMAGLGLTPFVAGQRYLMSYYAAAKTAEGFVWARNSPANGGDFGQGGRLITNTPRRIWRLVQAMDTSHVEEVTDPSVAWGAQGSSDPYWISAAGADTTPLDVWVGGFQIEQVASTYVDGIALIGDSTMAGSSGGKDLVANREVSRYLEGLLNVSIYNRAVGGRTLATIDAQYATDVSTIKHRCKYVVVQGGINDFGNDATLAAAQASINSIDGKAAADGLLPVYFTCTPSTGMASVAQRETNRKAFNAWLKTTFPRVIDIASVMEDQQSSMYLRREPSLVWWGDGTHYGQDAKRAIAAYAAEWAGWDFLSPSPYQPLAADAFDATPSALYLVDQANGNRYKVTVSGGALTVDVG